MACKTAIFWWVTCVDERPVKLQQVFDLIQGKKIRQMPLKGTPISISFHATEMTMSVCYKPENAAGNVTTVSVINLDTFEEVAFIYIVLVLLSIRRWTHP